MAGLESAAKPDMVMIAQLAATLQEYEEDDSAYWDRRHHEREKQRPMAIVMNAGTDRSICGTYFWPL